MAFPECLLLYAEFGIFSRAPFPRTFYFDPYGMFRDSYLRRFEAKLRARQLSSNEHEDLERFRRVALYDGIASYNPLTRRSLDPEHRFDHLVLLPLQFSEYFGFDAYCEYRTQFDYLVDVLERVPANVGVVVTEHGAWSPVITPHNEAHLRDRFPHFIRPPGISEFPNASQFLLQFVDGVVSVSSSVGLQSLVWGKPLFSPWDAPRPAGALRDFLS